MLFMPAFKRLCTALLCKACPLSDGNAWPLLLLSQVNCFFDDSMYPGHHSSFPRASCCAARTTTRTACGPCAVAGASCLPRAWSCVWYATNNTCSLWFCMCAMAHCAAPVQGVVCCAAGHVSVARGSWRSLFRAVIGQAPCTCTALQDHTIMDPWILAFRPHSRNFTAAATTPYTACLHACWGSEPLPCLPWEGPHPSAMSLHMARAGPHHMRCLLTLAQCPAPPTGARTQSFFKVLISPHRIHVANVRHQVPDPDRPPLEHRHGPRAGGRP